MNVQRDQLRAYVAELSDELRWRDEEITRLRREVDRLRALVPKEKP